MLQAGKVERLIVGNIGHYIAHHIPFSHHQALQSPQPPSREGYFKYFFFVLFPITWLPVVDVHRRRQHSPCDVTVVTLQPHRWLQTRTFFQKLAILCSSYTRVKRIFELKIQLKGFWRVLILKMRNFHSSKLPIESVVRFSCSTMLVFFLWFDRVIENLISWKFKLVQLFHGLEVVPF